jgi:glycerol-3-phosphate acyltransferase PlsY
MEFFWENLLVATLCLVYGYFWGSIPNGVLIGKIFFKKDPRDYGSHNSGGTNSGRVFGKKIGFLVIALDVIKAVVAFWSAWAILRFTPLREAWPLWDDGVFYNWLVLLGVSLGHCFSCWISFKGGKTVACFMGLIGGTSWIGFVLCWVTFLSIFLKKHVVSKASLVSGAILIAYEWLLYLICSLTGFEGGMFFWNFGFGGGLHYGVWTSGWEPAVVASIVYGILVYRHRQNIQRLKNGTEAPVAW